MVLARSNLTSRDSEILDALTLRVRVLSIRQIARTWFGETIDPERSAARRMRQLAARSLVEPITLLAHPELDLTEPVWTWSAGGPAPNFEPLSYRLASRWRETVRPTLAVIASAAAGNSLGGYGGRRPRRGEASHDLSLSTVFLRWRASNPTRIHHWRSEATLRQQGYGDHARLPDAMITQPVLTRAVELGGAYGSEKLRAFHQFCESRGLSYELW